MSLFSFNISAPRRTQRRRALSALACVLLLTATSCSTQTGFDAKNPPVELTPNFSDSGDSETPAMWWTVFDDRELEVMVNTAIEGNLSLRGTWDRLDQARAAARGAGSGLYPTLDAQAGASRTRNETAAMGRSYQSSISMGLAAGYEIDLWGRIKSGRDAAALDALASEENLRAAAVTLSAQVADAWYQLIEQRGQLNLLDAQIKTNAEYLSLIMLRFKRGQVPATDVLQQQQLLESKRGDRIQVVAGVKVLEHQLAVLMGRSPGTISLSAAEVLPELPELPNTGVPAEWVQTRPDLRSAWLGVQAADKRIAAAIADKFPRVSLSASGSTSGERVRDIFDNWLASIAANLVAPVLDGGRRDAEVDRTRAAASESLNRYGQTILESLKEVEDALVRESQQRKLLSSLEKQLELSRKSSEQTRDRYAKGSENYLRVLTALSNMQVLERTSLREKRVLIQHRISLYRALGGGWRMERPTGGPPESPGSTDMERGVEDDGK